ncbi:formate hydrogenlyase regulator HycA [Cronobacter turicensis]|jgi:formate hydrogenlyase regulatory protein HycA|uniref:Formate hydrogenlyase regulatory protein hycA n=1 Tax=Cronobacter turicensis (strain DSM 18703 / CCUG 55852 / LMG 23827 / z3032) TaxID=693216 RepID=C9Y2U3_CROTZ|nr:formate hydrogenlyase regulator HycA [Cronobacter turicensis]CBA30395.1 Formate hydrogenlyase regulatory protein hycA [Cronobacter turicensis z3032]EKM0376979.1 formate hydrogenlyase regulator HycA [Cronobacter turicensis]EKM5064063.1 formate hydrogenlyase regulator HycA [Cronobacter turicensis]EKY3200038.1 formate hydrogenlyase regulator HycA [Cronobacter turicensis]EKY3213052.1 formate hydrogenlyase regulator HycA [Cronobacter turicensis]
MILSELSQKAEFIADRHRALQTHWHTYCNTLVQAITLSRQKLHHSLGCEPQNGLCFFLFEHFAIRVEQAEGFHCRTINYLIARRDGSEETLLATAQLDAKGMLDGAVDIRDRERVLAHYLDKIGALYDGLYDAVQHDTPLHISEILAARDASSH